MISNANTGKLGKIWRRRIVSESDIRDAAKRLALKLRDQKPSQVVFLEDGGRVFGSAIADELKVPAIGMEVRYPLSRLLCRAPRIICALAWPIKELIYKFTFPRLGCSPKLFSMESTLLVDDSASSGKTLKTAVVALEKAGIDRNTVKTAVFRCGRRSKPMVDFYETGNAVHFISRR